MGRHHDPQRRRAFTLIELLIAIAILLTMVGLVVVNLMPAKDQADIDLTKTQIGLMAGALDHFKLRMKRYPTTDEGLRALWSADALEDDEDRTKWGEPYLKEPNPRDLWDNEWIYREPSEIKDGAAYDIVSMGPDGEEGTEDDITNFYRFMTEDGEMDDAFDDFGSDDFGT